MNIWDDSKKEVYNLQEEDLNDIDSNMLKDMIFITIFYISIVISFYSLVFKF